MKDTLIFGFKWIKFKIFAKHGRGQGIHSPFLYQLICDVLHDSTPFYAWEDIEKIRLKLLQNSDFIDVIDLGAGSKKTNSKQKKISDITRFSSVDKKNGELLFKLVNFFRPKITLELGTSVGLGTLYMASPNCKNTVYTIEACPETAKIAQQNFIFFGKQNIISKIGGFDEILPVILQEINRLDCVYFDGNHRKEPTLKYFELCLQKAHEQTVFVFDDIHWSPQMEEAWNSIRKHPKVTLSVDLFQKGIVFFRPELSKQHFVIRF